MSPGPLSSGVRDASILCDQYERLTIYLRSVACNMHFARFVEDVNKAGPHTGRGTRYVAQRVVLRRSRTWLNWSVSRIQTVSRVVNGKGACRRGRERVQATVWDTVKLRGLDPGDRPLRALSVS